MPRRYVGAYFGGWLWTLLLTLPHSLAVNLAFPAIAVNDNVYGCARGVLGARTHCPRMRHLPSTAAGRGRLWFFFPIDKSAEAPGEATSLCGRRAVSARARARRQSAAAQQLDARVGGAHDRAPVRRVRALRHAAHLHVRAALGQPQRALVHPAAPAAARR